MTTKRKYRIDSVFQRKYGAVILQGMTGENAFEMHRALRDYGLTYLVQSGKYCGGHHMLVQLGLKVGLRLGGTFFSEVQYQLMMLRRWKGKEEC
jgi:chemotaxis response regulator CheB